VSAGLRLYYGFQPVSAHYTHGRADVHVHVFRCRKPTPIPDVSLSMGACGFDLPTSGPWQHEVRKSWA
jgi:hypothetical protein